MARKNYFGLSQAGGELNPLWGAAAAAAVGTGTSVAVRAMSANDKNAELIGLGAGTAVSAAMLASKKTRAAGVAGLVTVAVTQGIRVIEAKMSCKQQIKDLRGAEATYNEKLANPTKTCKTQLTELKAAVAPKGLGIATAEVRKRRALGAVQVEKRTLAAPQVESRQLAGGNLGIVSPEVVRTLSGAPAGVQIQGVNGSSNMPTLVGGLGGGFGATVFGGN